MNVISFFKSILNKFLPKFNRVIVVGSMQIECNALELANYIKENYSLPVYLTSSKEFLEIMKPLTVKGVKVANVYSLRFKLLSFTSKYIFSTHGFTMNNSSKNQIEVNVWHGVGHKKIRLARNEKGIPADITVATSELSKKMFPAFFGVPEETMFISGYPRNDQMLRAKNIKEDLKSKLNPDLNRYNKAFMWMPTFTRIGVDKIDVKNGLFLGSPFQIDNFDVNRFNEILKQNNSICLLKPHYFYMHSKEWNSFSNILLIDDKWIYSQKITLYELLACTDVLITDFSSVMIDYTLLDQPIVCFSTDLEGFRNNQGLYFEDIENWLPTKLIEDQETFFNYIKKIINTGEDCYSEKRKKIRDVYFSFKDDKSTRRLVSYVLGKENKLY